MQDARHEAEARAAAEASQARRAADDRAAAADEAEQAAQRRISAQEEQATAAAKQQLSDAAGRHALAEQRRRDADRLGQLTQGEQNPPGQTDHRQTRLSGLPGGGWPVACHRGEATPGDRTTAAPSSAMRRSPIGVPEPRLHTIASATSRRGSAHPPEPPKPK